METGIRVLIADDHAIVRRGVREILLEQFHTLEIDEARNFEEVRHLVNERQWNLFILDINMPGGNIIDILTLIQTMQPQSSTLILSMCPEEQYAIQMLKAGVAGYLTKESVAEELVIAVNEIQNGGKYISSSLAGKIADTVMSQNALLLHETLSSREFQVFLQIASGKSLKKIAEELCVSDRTISTYRYRILEKMKVKTNSELIQYAIRHHLFDPQ